jgi:pimeloyl-ACP methyl ester carboxylesterase
MTYERPPERHKPCKPTAKSDAVKDDPVITVWIHGTKFVRSDTYRRVYNGIPDVKHINEFPSEHAIQFQMCLLDRDAPTLFGYNNLYLFGWSGRLSTHERYGVAAILYQKLAVLAESYQQKHGKEPCIRLVTHSHGGNVALNLARIHKKQKAQFTIDTLVLLACPVQHETKKLAESNFFNKVYAFYSSLDMVQVMAPEFVYRMRNDEDSIIGSCLRWIPFSHRCFEARSCVRQAWIKMNGHGLMHSSFAHVKFLRTLPHLIKAVDELYQEHGKALYKGKKELLLHVRSKCVNCCP